MVAYVCWTGLVGVGIVCGITTAVGFKQCHHDVSVPRSTIQNLDDTRTSAAQRFVASRPSHWKDLLLAR